MVRFEPKGFAQRRPSGKGQWLWDARDVRRVLYRLPDLCKADPAVTVYVVEREKDVHTLERYGLLATTNPGGAGKWRTDYSEQLRGRRVLLAPDNDAPGRDHARQVAESMRGVAGELRRMTLPAGVKDATEFFEKGNSIAQWQELAVNSPELRGPEPPEPRPSCEAACRPCRPLPDCIAAGLLGEYLELAGGSTEAPRRRRLALRNLTSPTRPTPFAEGEPEPRRATRLCPGRRHRGAPKPAAAA